MNKFRTRRYIRQYFKENKEEKTINLDLKNFNDNQINIVLDELWKLKIIQLSRKTNQLLSIQTH
ncbi:hypothetical protein CI088_08000 [Enterococcus plantarum]|uniref:Uncharacterized protein n=1 Tax=Enterococcus plantarum TaxID=1077675 RepID=A0A2W3Z8X4_9ENTE|nr:hypothetical protein [Enterococcus plantarum]PZL73760.1 hypothetical protein CI088_08000 [Enterococcus plantarum]